MSQFKVGDFQRDRLATPLQAFCPTASAYRLKDIQLEGLYNRGKRLLLLDMDNTVTLWRSEELPEEAVAWVEQAKKIGFQICFLSNTRHPDRLQRLAGRLGVPFIRGKFKPSRSMYLQALDQFSVTANQAIMIGDQLLTDVLGANRSGIEAIWLEPMGHKEFAGTKVSRFIERRLVGSLYNVMVTPISADADEAPALEHAKPLWERTIVKQLIKFAVVGGSCFIIDAGLTALFVTKLSFGGQRVSPQVGQAIISALPGLKGLPAPLNWFKDDVHAGANVMSAIAALIAMFNSFFWNRRWTFQITTPEERGAQLRKFFVVAIIGYIIQTSVFSMVLAQLSHVNGGATTMAKAVGAAIAAVWNFAGQRLYAFRRKSQ